MSGQTTIAIKMIGLGGIGSILSEKISRFLNYSKHKAHITFIDGDSYEDKNRERQEFLNLGAKAKIKQQENEGRFPEIKFNSIPKFITEFMNDETRIPVTECIHNGDVVFLCVDNHKTRRVISKHVEKLNDITLISGGNDFLDGNVQIYIRKEGKDLTPSLTSYHPEIETPDDKSPDEMSCEELAKSDPQLYFVNLGVATYMCWAFFNYVVNKAEKDEIQASEVYFDMPSMCSDAKIRNVQTKVVKEIESNG